MGRKLPFNLGKFMNSDIDEALEIVAAGSVVVVASIAAVITLPLWGPVWCWLKITRRRNVNYN